MRYRNILDKYLRQCATAIPEDVEAVLNNARGGEKPDGTAAGILSDLLENCRLARTNCQPICQDTGMIHIYVKPGWHFNYQEFLTDLRDSVADVTRQGLLRPNCVQAVSGMNTGNNLSEDHPALHILPGGDSQETQVSILLKGGGSENMGCQYSLPDARLQAGRDWDGVHKCLLDAACNIQGQGCAPGIFAVAVGSDRSGGYAAAKALLLRRLDSVNPVLELAEKEKSWLAELNQLGIGPMGLGGSTTALAVFLQELTRHPACFFVSIAYNCWCCRRQQFCFSDDELSLLPQQ